MSFEDIESAAAPYAAARAALAGRVDGLRSQIDQAKRAALPGIRTAVAAVMQHQAALREAIEANADLFVRPKTQIVSGIKVGFQQSRDKLVWDDAAAVIAGIRRHFPEQADLMIQTVERPVDAALRGLSESDLRRIGVLIEGGKDEVVIKPADAEVDKIVDALLRDELAEVE